MNLINQRIDLTIPPRNLNPAIRSNIPVDVDFKPSPFAVRGAHVQAVTNNKC